MKKIFVAILLLVFNFSYSQSIHGFDIIHTSLESTGFDSSQRVTLHTSTDNSTKEVPVKAVRVAFNARPFIVPAALITYGAIALNNNKLRSFDWRMKSTINNHSEDFKSCVDDFTQYAPSALVYGLNAVGIKGKNNFADRTIMYGLTTLMTGGIVCSIKTMSGVTRPDGSATNSFPSGHTTTAFAAAEFLHQEYKHKSIWYSVFGYTAASATGLLRMYNNRHFLSDVICGAGLGIISTKLVYAVYPAVKRKLTRKRSNTVLL